MASNQATNTANTSSSTTSITTTTTTHHSPSPSTIAISRQSSVRNSSITALDLESTSSQPPTERNASPSRASVISTSSNLTTSTVPQLKRKHRRHHIRHQQQPHSAQSLHLTTTRDETFPLAQAIEQSQPNASAKQTPLPLGRSALPSPPSLGQSKVTLSRSNTAPSPRRAPASHSSYGVETTSGPPPSFETQKTLSTERVWQFDRSKSLRMTLTADRGRERPSSITSHDNEDKPWRTSALVTPQLVHSSPDTVDTPSVPTPTDAEEVVVMEARNEDGLALSQSEVGSKTSNESRKSEDLFLNIAKVEPPRPAEKRKSRILLPFFSTARPATSYRPGTSHADGDTISTVARSEAPQHTKRASLGHPDTASLSRSYFSQPRMTDTLSERDGFPGRRTSALYTDTIKPSRLGAVRNSRMTSESAYPERSKLIEQNTTESTVSTAAPSTVWDELDDLKSRIRKLEITGKIPASSAAAMSTAERPRTATTAATTMSGSPKHNKVPNTLPSAIEGVPSDVHPLLHEAMANVKAAVSHDVYQKLQSTAQDALMIAQMVHPNNLGQETAHAAPSAVERQLSRKAESMCRSLTELAIALSAEAKGTTHDPRPASRDVASSQSPDLVLRSRRYSNTNEAPDRSTIRMRVQSRLEGRRTSSQFNGSSPELELPTALPFYPGSGSKLPPRLSAAYRTRASNAYLDGVSNDDEEVLNVRPISRAMTEVARLRRASRDSPGTSREYTSQHPLPIPVKTNPLQSESIIQRTPLPSRISTNFISRRKYASPSTALMPAGQQNPESSPLGDGSWGSRIGGRRR